MRIKKNLWKLLNQKIIGAASLKQVITDFTAGISSVWSQQRKYILNKVFLLMTRVVFGGLNSDNFIILQAQLLSRVDVSGMMFSCYWVQPVTRSPHHLCLPLLQIIQFLDFFFIPDDISWKFSPREGGSSAVMISPEPSADHSLLINNTSNLSLTSLHYYFRFHPPHQN